MGMTIATHKGDPTLLKDIRKLLYNISKSQNKQVRLTEEQTKAIKEITER